jgi:hypothetical protein
VHLEASTKPHVHQKIQIFWTNIAFTMACPNLKNGPKNGLGPLGVNLLAINNIQAKSFSILVYYKQGVYYLPYC